MMRRGIFHGLCWLVLLTGCSGGNGTDGRGAVESPAGGDAIANSDEGAAGKPSAPIAIDYDVIGTPLVGQPVNIDLSVRSTQGDAPVRITYRVLDPDSMSFPDTQAREVALRVGATEPAVRQVTVVPQREGRLYLNVTAEIETPDGAMIRSIAIPVQVGSGPAERQPNGTLTEDADGNPVISLPADET